MTAPEIHMLTGAYAVDGLSDDERAAFEEHLVDCPACAEEVRELRETAAMLGLAVAEPLPAGLRGSVLDAVANTRRLPPELPAEQPLAAVVPLRRPRWPLAVSMIATAAAVAVAVVLGVRVTQRGDQLQAARGEVAGIASVVDAGDAQMIRAGDGSGPTGTVVLSRSQGKAVFVASGMPAAPSGHDYQVWLIGSHETISAGLLRPGSGQQMQPVLASGLGEATSFGVTVEPAGGSQHPTTDPIMVLNLA